uniref:Uncharacterized protein n=1 Tax=Rhodnius prolixus TaxID=13249 RepID=T1HGB0_RHOPR
MGRKYLLTIFVWLCLITLPLALAQGENENGTVVDCRKYPYAPVCRGAGAKRLYLYSPQEINYEDMA